MGEGEVNKKYNLEERTLAFAKQVIALVNATPRNLANIEIGKQLIRSAGSVGANYIEANESLSKKDFLMRIKICRKEAKEASYWLKLLDCNEEIDEAKNNLIGESGELTKIFGSIMRKVSPD